MPKTDMTKTKKVKTQYFYKYVAVGSLSLIKWRSKLFIFLKESCDIMTEKQRVIYAKRSVENTNTHKMNSINSFFECLLIPTYPHADVINEQQI